MWGEAGYEAAFIQLIRGKRWWPESRGVITTTLRSQNLVCARIVVEIGSKLTKSAPVQSHNSFLDQRSRKVIVDFTGTVFVQCANPVVPT